MIILLSPSKTLGDGATAHKAEITQPALIKESETLIKAARKLSIQDLQGLMGISEKLATLNHTRFKQFTTPFAISNATPSIFTFQGDVYDGLDAISMTAKEVSFAQDHLRILSGLYGVLRPLDLMQPYRLEMGISLKNERGKHLYAFWGDRITEQINDAVLQSKSDAVINLASGEYFRAVNTKKLSCPVITPTFKESRNGTVKIIGLMAKKARGRMARWIISNRITQAKDLHHYHQDGYRLAPEISSATTPIYIRTH